MARQRLKRVLARTAMTAWATLLPWGSLYASDIDAKINEAMESLNKECTEYASVLTDAMWSAVTSKAQAQGKSIPDSYRYSLFKVQFGQCMTVQKIEIFESLKKNTSQENWTKLDGDARLKTLHSDLMKTVWSGNGVQ